MTRLECFLGFLPASAPESSAGDAFRALRSRLECVLPGSSPAPPAMLLAAPSPGPATAAAAAAPPGICSAAPAGAKSRDSSKPSRAICRWRSWLRAKSITRASQEHQKSITRASQEHRKSITRAPQAHHKSIARAPQEHQKSITRASQEHHKSTTCGPSAAAESGSSARPCRALACPPPPAPPGACH